MEKMEKIEDEEKGASLIGDCSNSNDIVKKENVTGSITDGNSTKDIENDEVKVNDENVIDRSSCKVVVYNILKFNRENELDSMIEEWLSHGDPKDVKIRVVKKKKPPRCTWVRLTLESEEMVEPFVNLINNHEFKNRKGCLIRASASLGRKRSREEEEEEGEEHKNKKLKDVRDKVTPLWTMSSYSDQLKHKWREIIKRCARKIVQEILKIFRKRGKDAKYNKHVKIYDVFDWLKEKSPVKVEPILGSPDINEYRNKVEFTFGFTTDKIPTLGFMTGGYKTAPSSPINCQNIPSQVCGIHNIVDTFLKSSKIPAYDPQTHTGIWRIMTIRLSKRTNQCMIVIMHAPYKTGVSLKEDYSLHWDDEVKQLVQLLTSAPIPLPTRPPYNNTLDDETDTQVHSDIDCIAKPLQLDYNISDSTSLTNPMKVTSIFLQEYIGLSSPPPNHPIQHLWGSTTFDEILGYNKFQISHGSFFQTNTVCAEVLYRVVSQQIKNNASNEGNDDDKQEILLLDVCCGTGTIGLTCLKEGVVQKVWGVDISEPAIKDAKLNALNNGYDKSNSESDPICFIASKAEAVLEQKLKSTLLMHQENSSNKPKIIAVVDPARDGLHSSVIKALKSTTDIQKIIYVSCNPSGSLVRDAAMLCGPPTKKYQGQPFKPVFAQPIDMFPMTNHCEVVMVFERLTKEEFSPPENVKKD